MITKILEYFLKEELDFIKKEVFNVGYRLDNIDRCMQYKIREIEQFSERLEDKLETVFCIDTQRYIPKDKATIFIIKHPQPSNCGINYVEHPENVNKITIKKGQLTLKK